MRFLLVLAFVVIVLHPYSANSSDNQAIDIEVDDVNRRVSALQSKQKQLEENVDSKNQYLARCESAIQEMDENIKHLRSVISDFKNFSRGSDHRMLNALEDEKRTIWSNLRKTNFNIHLLQSRVEEAESRLSSLKSEADKMADIVTEQWIEIRHFEQAFQLTQKRLQMERKETSPLSFIIKFFHKVRNFTKLDTLFFLSRRFHHKLQGKIKQHMDKHVITSQIANPELVFWMVSAIIVFPIVAPLIFLTSKSKRING